MVLSLSARSHTRGVGKVEITRPFYAVGECSLQFGCLFLELFPGLLDIMSLPNAGSRRTAQTRGGQHVTCRWRQPPQPTPSASVPNAEWVAVLICAWQLQALPWILHGGWSGAHPESCREYMWTGEDKIRGRKATAAGKRDGRYNARLDDHAGCHIVSVRFCRKRQRSRGPVQRKRHLCCTGLQAKLSCRSLTRGRT